MSDEEKNLDVKLTEIIVQIPLLSEMIKDHKKALISGTGKMQSLEVQLARLKCGEHNIRIKNCEKHIEHGFRWRVTIVGIAVGLFITIAGFLKVFWVTSEKVNSLERTVYSEAKN